MTPYEAIYKRQPYLAQLTDNNGELASLFIKTIQAIYLFVTDKKRNPETITYRVELNSDGLIVKLNARKGTTIVRDFYTRRMNDYGKIAEALKGIRPLFTTIAQYQAEHTGVTTLLSASGDKIIINGEKKNGYR